MLIKDLQTGTVRKYGSDHHDSLMISQDGMSLSYYNLQCGEGSKYGDYRFVMEDGKVPAESETFDAMYAECYFNIGGFDKEPSEKTNEAKIKKMTTWELAKFIYDISDGEAKITTCTEECDKCDMTDGWCISSIAEWLMEESECTNHQ